MQRSIHFAWYTIYWESTTQTCYKPLSKHKNNKVKMASPKNVSHIGAFNSTISFIKNQIVGQAKIFEQLQDSQRRTQNLCGMKGSKRIWENQSKVIEWIMLGYIHHLYFFDQLGNGMYCDTRWGCHFLFHEEVYWSSNQVSFHRARAPSNHENHQVPLQHPLWRRYLWKNLTTRSWHMTKHTTQVNKCCISCY